MFSRRILTLSAVLLVLTIVFFLMEKSDRGADANGDAVVSKKPFFQNLKLRDLRRVTHLSPGPKFGLVLESDGAWAVLDKRFVVLDPRELRKYFDAIFALAAENVLTADEAAQMREQHGLDTPQVSLQIDWDSGKSDTLHFGNKNPVSGRRYMRRNDDPKVYLVEDYNAHHLSASLDRVRLSTPFALAPEEVTSIVVRSASSTEHFQTYALNRVGSAWSIVAGDTTWAGDDEFITRKIKELAIVQADAYLDPPSVPLTEIKNAPPLLEFEIRFRKIDQPIMFALWEAYPSEEEPQSPAAAALDQAVKEADIGKRKSVYVERKGWPTIFRLGRRVHLDFLHGPTAFRERKPFQRIQAERVQSICVEESKLPSKNSGKVVGYFRIDAPGSRSSSPEEPKFVRRESCSLEGPSSSVPFETVKVLISRIRALPVLSHLDSRTAYKGGDGQPALDSRSYQLTLTQSGANGNEEFRLNVLQPVETQNVSGDKGIQRTTPDSDDSTETLPPYFALFSAPNTVSDSGAESAKNALVYAVVNGGEVESLRKKLFAPGYSK